MASNGGRIGWSPGAFRLAFGHTYNFDWTNRECLEPVGLDMAPAGAASLPNSTRRDAKVAVEFVASVLLVALFIWAGLNSELKRWARARTPAARAPARPAAARGSLARECERLSALA